MDESETVTLEQPKNTMSYKVNILKNPPVRIFSFRKVDKAPLQEIDIRNADEKQLKKAQDALVNPSIKQFFHDDEIYSRRQQSAVKGNLHAEILNRMQEFKTFYTPNEDQKKKRYIPV